MIGEMKSSPTIACDICTTRFAESFLSCLAFTLLCLTSDAHALPRTSADFNLTPESLNGGGQRTTSASYSNEGGLGDLGGLAIAASPSVAVMSGYIGALETVGILPTLTTVPATGTTATGTTLAGDVTNDGGSEVITRGIVLSATPDPTVELDTVVTASPGTGFYIVPVTGLSPGTTYHARAFATTMVGTGYGANVYFTTDTGVNFVGGIAGFSRTILAGDRHVFAFSLTGPRVVSFTTTGGASLRAALFNGQGGLIASFDGDGDFALQQLLLAGNYALHVYREPGAGSPQNFNLALDAREVATTRPDVAVGASAASLVGVGIYSPVVQTVTLTSLKTRRVTGYATIANSGKLPDVLAVSGGGGSLFFRVDWFGPTGGNITAALNSGAYRTAAMAEGTTPVSLTAKITPNKKKLKRKNKKTKRVTYLRKTLLLSLGASSTIDPAISDAATIQVKTK